jgi:elongator complex protein 6
MLTISADEPLIAAQTTTLEKEHAALALSLAHEADLVISLRLLDSGAAKDVSGVMRITRGGQDSGLKKVEEHEYLYFIGGDGGVKVFERGH